MANRIKPFGASRIPMMDRRPGNWPKKLGTSTLGANFVDFASYEGPLLQEGAEIERVEHGWQLTTRGEGFDSRSGPWQSKEHVLDEIREMSTAGPKAKKGKRTMSLADKYDRYRSNWRSSPRLKARYAKGKAPPRG